MNFGRIGAFDNLDLVRRQYRLTSGLRIDLLCRDAQSGDLVIVELKHDAADERVVAQLFLYLDALKHRATNEEVGVRALLITAECNPSLLRYIQQLSAATGFQVDWHTYTAGFDLSSAIVDGEVTASKRRPSVG